ncbi:MAG TPA: hypothetical protein VEW05_26685 [Candidatus Polarisedimenticolia bacterium]|nr:hypothetical protein [Candidatus Polarisedimenticolia bacterium]
MTISAVAAGPGLFFAGEDNTRSTEAAPAARIIKETVIGDAYQFGGHLEKSDDKSEVT